MHKIVAYTITAFYCIVLCYGQDQKNHYETISFGPMSKELRKCFYDLRTSLKICMLKYPIVIPEVIRCYNDSSFVYSEDSIRIILKSDISWELLGEPPKLPFLFFFKKDTKEVKDAFKYLKFKGACETNNKIAYELIGRFDIYRKLKNHQGVKCSKLKYEIKPDSVGTLEIVDVIFISDFGSQ